MTSGRLGMPQALIDAAGGRNILDDVDASWTRVNWETVVERNPQVIVIVDYSEVSAEQKQQFLLNNKALQGVDAIKNQRFIVIPYVQATPGIDNVLAVETLAKVVPPGNGLPRRMTSPRYAALLMALGALLLASCVVSLGFGPARVPVEVVGRILLHKALGLGVVDWSPGQEHIVWLIRVPRMLLGALVGAGLALIGAVLQAVTRNPLADPHLLGVTSGATLGAVIVVLHLGQVIGLLTLPLAAFVGALLSMALVLGIAARNGRLDSDRLLLCGVAVSFVMMAAANLLLFMGDHRASSAVMFWMLGGLGLARWELLAIPAASVLLGLVLLLGMARPLNALMAGEQTAVTLGLNARNVRLKVFLIASLMTGVLVSISGSIGFVGLMVPHIARRLVGAEHRRLLPVCVLLGSLFLVWVDVAARTLIAPEDLPIGVATAAIGGVFFIGLMRRR
jgi:iron complex transport system permease protein